MLNGLEKSNLITTTLFIYAVSAVKQANWSSMDGQCKALVRGTTNLAGTFEKDV